MSNFKTLKKEFPKIAKQLDGLSQEQLLNKFAKLYFETKINDTDFGYLSARVKEVLEQQYGEKHIAIISNTDSKILFTKERYL